MAARATVNANLQTQNADLVRTDEYTARGTANLAIARGTEGPARVTGTVRTTEVRFDLGQPPPGGVEEIAVIEVNRPPDLGAIVPPDRSPEVLRTAELSIDINMPDRVFVVGYGVNAEWRGDVSVRGTLGDPVILGQLALVRGDAEVLGRQFELEQGLVTIDPFAPGNARIRIVGANVQPGLTVRVTADGSAAAPRLEWTSTPALPRDEILSRLYFGRASPSLNAYEAVQLAQLSGFIGGLGATGGVLGFARRVTGLDVLRLEAPVAGAEGGPRVAVGKYVTDRIYVGAVTGADASSSALQVEVQITPNISVQVETGADARQAAGVLWQRDY
jgi:translocation and assembly module TamB